MQKSASPARPQFPFEVDVEDGVEDEVEDEGGDEDEVEDEVEVEIEVEVEVEVEVEIEIEVETEIDDLGAAEHPNLERSAHDRTHMSGRRTGADE